MPSVICSRGAPMAAILAYWRGVDHGVWREMGLMGLMGRMSLMGRIEILDPFS